jgi:hypothetical protein
MITRDELHANFGISERAKAVILALMDRVADEDGEYPEAFAIKWARIIFNDGLETPYDVHIGFYDRATFPGDDPGNWTVINGIRVVFMMDPPLFQHFYGKTLDIDDNGKAFLRD